MDRNGSANLIRNTFEHPFDKTRFERFVRELLNRYDPKSFGPLTGNYIEDSFQGGIGSYERIGKYTDAEGILLPNKLFSNENRTPEGDIGDGILDVFDRFNFTVCEDEPLEKEVAVDPEMLGKVFENLLEVRDRKSKGTYYTPREIVHYMCQESLIHHLATEVSAVPKEDVELLVRHGEAVIENEAAVECKGKETDTYTYKLPDSIRANAAALDTALQSIRVCDPAVGSGAFLVGMMTTSEKELLRRAFPSSAEYKISMYAVFMDRAYQLAKPQGGLQTLIVPDSFLLGRYFSKIRGLIVDHNHILSVLLMTFKVFDATVGFPVVYMFMRTASVNEAHRLSARFAEQPQAVQRGNYAQCSYEQSYFSQTKFNRFRLFFQKRVMDLVLKMEQNCRELGQVVRFSSGLIGVDGQDTIVHRSQQNDKWLPGIISGSEVKRYCVCPDGYYILYDKNHIKSGYDCVDYFSEKLLMRQTGDCLICAIDRSGLLALNNVHVGNLLDARHSLLYIEALMNSSLLNFYYRAISLETGRAMAQTDIETLETLPIKDCADGQSGQIVRLAETMHSLCSQGREASGNAINAAELQECQDRINELVYEIYGLSRDEIALVRQCQA